MLNVLIVLTIDVRNEWILQGLLSCNLIVEGPVWLLITLRVSKTNPWRTSMPLVQLLSVIEGEIPAWKATPQGRKTGWSHIISALVPSSCSSLRSN